MTSGGEVVGLLTGVLGVVGMGITVGCRGANVEMGCRALLGGWLTAVSPGNVGTSAKICACTIGPGGGTEAVVPSSSPAETVLVNKAAILVWRCTWCTKAFPIPNCALGIVLKHSSIYDNVI